MSSSSSSARKEANRSLRLLKKQLKREQTKKGERLMVTTPEQEQLMKEQLMLNRFYMVSTGVVFGAVFLVIVYQIPQLHQIFGERKKVKEETRRRRLCEDAIKQERDEQPQDHA